jgi:hypothetical protein
MSYGRGKQLAQRMHRKRVMIGKFPGDARWQADDISRKKTLVRLLAKDFGAGDGNRAT